MIVTQNNARTRAVLASDLSLPHAAVIEAARAKLIELHGPDSFNNYHEHASRERFSTTKDGKDAVWSVMVGQPRFKPCRTTKLWLGFINADSRRQGSYVYGGLMGYENDWAMVLNRYPLCGRRNLPNMRETVRSSVEAWTLDTQGYEERYKELCGRWPMPPAKSEYLSIELAREGILSWKHVGQVDALWDKQSEHPADFLKRVSRVVARRPPVQAMPPVNQMGVLYSVLLRVLKS